MDSCPDRWGQLLMKRREAIEAREEDRTPRTLAPWDFLLGVQDCTRMGALRFSHPGESLYLANEGKCIIICDQDGAEEVLQLIRRMPEGKDAALIGWVRERGEGRVSLTTRIGGSRLLEPLTGHPLPRIC